MLVFSVTSSRRIFRGRVDRSLDVTLICESTNMQLSRRQILQGLLSSATTAAALNWGRLLQADDVSDREVSWLTEVQWPPDSLKLKPDPLSPLLVDRNGNSITSRDGWEQHKQFLSDRWREVIRPLPIDPLVPPQVTVLGEERFDGLLRQHLSYEVEPGEVVEAYLMKPDPCPEKSPAVAVFHSTVNHSILQPAGLAEDREKAFGWKLARKGMVTLSPRNFLWPTIDKIDTKLAMERYRAKHPHHTGMARMLLDAQLAVSLLAHDPHVDATRIGSVGHSLGAKEVLYLAAFDERVKVTVSSEGGIGIGFSNWEAEWYLGDQVQQPDFGREHHELLALIAPRPFLLIGGDSADGEQGWPFIVSARQVYELYPGPVRFGQFNHKQGHKVTPAAEQRIDEWLVRYL